VSAPKEIDLKRFTLLADLAEDEREKLAEELEELRLEEGTVLFDEGDPGEGLLFVAEGGLRVQSSRTPDSAALGPGASLGALALVVTGPREARAEATSRSRLLVLPRSAFRRFADAEPRAACRLLEAILRDTARLGREALDSVGPGAVDRVRADD
jgi:CRP/FNR family cyclic AMP-dependent transcriptional regulator